MTFIGFLVFLIENDYDVQTLTCIFVGQSNPGLRKAVIQSDAEKPAIQILDKPSRLSPASKTTCIHIQRKPSVQVILARPLNVKLSAYVNKCTPVTIQEIKKPSRRWLFRFRLVQFHNVSREFLYPQILFSAIVGEKPVAHRIHRVPGIIS